MLIIPLILLPYLTTPCCKYYNSILIVSFSNYSMQLGAILYRVTVVDILLLQN